jgi:hypothetical protein
VDVRSTAGWGTRADPHARDRVLLFARPGISCLVSLRTTPEDVLASIRDTCPESPPKAD